MASSERFAVPLGIEKFEEIMTLYLRYFAKTESALEVGRTLTFDEWAKEFAEFALKRD